MLLPKDQTTWKTKQTQKHQESFLFNIDCFRPRKTPHALLSAHALVEKRKLNPIENNTTAKFVLLKRVMFENSAFIAQFLKSNKPGK